MLGSRAGCIAWCSCKDESTAANRPALHRPVYVRYGADRSLASGHSSANDEGIADSLLGTAALVSLASFAPPLLQSSSPVPSARPARKPNDLFAQHLATANRPRATR